MRSVYTEAVALHQIHLLLSVLYEQVVVLCTAREGMKGIPVPLQVIFASDKDSGLKNVTGPMLAAQNSTTFLLTGLVINTLYSISVRAVTGAGPGENVTDSISTAEDGEGDPHTCMHKHTHTHSCKRTHTHIHTHTHTHTCKHACTPHTYAHTSLAPAVHACVRTATPHAYLCASFHAAPPLVTALNSQANENGISITWTPPGLENGDYFYRLSVSFESTFSDAYPQRSEKGSFVHEFARVGANGVAFSSFLLMNTSDNTQQQVASSNTLPHRIRSSALYSFSLFGVNRRFNESALPDLNSLTTPNTRK